MNYHLICYHLRERKWTVSRVSYCTNFQMFSLTVPNPLQREKGDGDTKYLGRFLLSVIVWYGDEYDDLV